MRFPSDEKLNESKIKSGFLWFPKTGWARPQEDIFIQTRWLEYATWRTRGDLMPDWINSLSELSKEEAQKFWEDSHENG